MRWINAGYARPLAAFFLLSSCVLQVLWLKDIYHNQRETLIEALDKKINEASRSAIVHSLALKEPSIGATYQHFLMSPELGLLRMAFDEMRVKGLNKGASYKFSTDSLRIELYLSVPSSNKTVNTNPSPHNNTRKVGRLPEDDQADLAYLRKLVAKAAMELHIKGNISFVIEDYLSGEPIRLKTLAAADHDYQTMPLSYDFQHLKKVRFFFSSIRSGIFYAMRFYLLSAMAIFLMTLLTLYLLLSLLRSQKLYADARLGFTANMTHELKTPLAIVSLALESISKYDLINQPDKLEEYIMIGRHELKRLDDMIEKVLDLGKDDIIVPPLKPASLDVNEILMQVVLTMQFVQEGITGAIIDLDLASSPCRVYGDFVHLSNVFYNLVENAIKFGDYNVRIHVSSKYVGDLVQIVFTDDGPGIDRLYHETIFERFFRAPTEESHTVKGTGLGLYYVKQIIQAHSGNIELKSSRGKGAKFTISLPRLDEK
jgi:signal transduction histidine kinase